MNRRYLALLGLISVVASCGGGSRPEKPNILLISIDSLRPDHLGAYGYSRSTSPFIDQLAAEGTLFETVTSSSSWSLPAHASLFTSLPESAHGAEMSGRVLASEHETLAERLKESGYQTMGFWSGPLLSPRFGFDQGFDEYEALGLVAEIEGEEGDAVAISHRDVTGYRILDRVQVRLSDHLSDSPGTPFFMFVHLWDAHYDYLAPEPFRSRFKQDYSGSIDGRNLAALASSGSEAVSDSDIGQLRVLYDQEISWIDEQVGRLVGLLESSQIADDTIVVVTADHGEEFYEHGSYGHRRKLYEESIRIPLIVRYPAKVPAGLRIGSPAHITDVAPTVTDLAEVQPLANASGMSLVSLLEPTSIASPRVTISELAHENGFRLLAVRGEDWKVIVLPETRRIRGFWNLAEESARESQLAGS